jgi:damage-control phosphatase, subfamily I
LESNDADYRNLPMQPMRIQAECRACLVRLVDLTVELATEDPDLRSAAKDAALAIIEEEFAPQAIPALIASRFHREIKNVTGNPDPFRPHKEAETAFLGRHFRSVAPAYSENLESLLKLAVLGNAVDFFRSADEVSQEFSQDITFTVSYLEAFEERLNAAPGLLLYLADNAGEQHFDAPLVQHLRRRGWQAVYVVKGGPIQNDLSRADLEASGLLEHLAPVWETGAETVGLVLAEASPWFQEVYGRARLILAKGMGHFETLGRHPDPRLFFLFQAKCRPIAQALGVPVGSFVFVHAEAISLDKNPVDEF